MEQPAVVSGVRKIKTTMNTFNNFFQAGGVCTDECVSPSQLRKKKKTRLSARFRHGAGKRRREKAVRSRIKSSALKKADDDTNEWCKTKESRESRVRKWLDMQRSGTPAEKKHNRKRNCSSGDDAEAEAPLSEQKKQQQKEKPALPSAKKSKFSFSQLIGTAKQKAKQRFQLYGSSKTKRELIQTLVPADRAKQGFRVIITGPSGCGKSFLLNKIQQSFKNILTAPDILLLKKSNLDIPIGRHILVCIDDIESMSPEAMAFLKAQMEGKVQKAKKATKKKRKPKSKVQALKPNQPVNATSYLLSCKDVYQLPKALKWVRGLYMTKLYAPWESELMSYATHEIRISVKTKDGRTISRRPFQRDIRLAVQACRRNFRQLEHLLHNPGTSASDERLNVFEEAKRFMKSEGRFGNTKLTDTGKEMLIHNIYDNMSDKKQFHTLCTALDTISLGDSLGTTIGGFISDNCFAGVDVWRPKTEFPTSTFQTKSCIRERHALQQQMSNFWSVAGGTGRRTLDVGELKFRHCHQLKNVDPLDVQNAMLTSRAASSLIPSVDDWMFKSI